MRIGKRLFPYPVLNSDLLQSRYNDSCTVKLKFDDSTSDQVFALHNVCCDINCDSINQLISDAKAKIVLSIECPQTQFRELCDISNKPQNIEIPISKIDGKIIISAFVIATQNFDNYSSPDFIEDYKGYTFSIEKHDVLAVDEGYIEQIETESEDEIKKSSIFTIYKIIDSESNDGKMEVHSDGDFIEIGLHEKAYDVYYKTKNKFEDLYLSILGVPALENSINDFKNTDYDDTPLEIDDMESLRTWFKSFSKSFLNKYGRALTRDDLFDLNSLIQAMFDYPIGKSIVDLGEKLSSSAEEDFDYD